jgi:hypothetical protein
MGAPKVISWLIRKNRIYCDDNKKLIIEYTKYSNKLETDLDNMADNTSDDAHQYLKKKDISKLKLLIKEYHAVGENYPTIHPFFMDILKDNDLKELHESTLDNVSWGLTWYISYCRNNDDTEPSILIMCREILKIIDNMTIQEKIKTKLKISLSYKLNKSNKVILMNEKLLDVPFGKKENKDAKCIYATYLSNNMHLLNYKYDRDRPDKSQITNWEVLPLSGDTRHLLHIENHCQCVCNCSKCWMQFCSEYRDEIVYN